MKLTPTLRSTLITITSFILVITAVHAWSPPSLTPPDGNVSVPITISAVSQSKAGGLDVAWLNAVGSVKVGYTDTACSADLGGTIRFNTSNNCLEYCDKTAWKCSSTVATPPPPPPPVCVPTAETVVNSYRTANGYGTGFSVTDTIAVTCNVDGTYNIFSRTGCLPDDWGSCDATGCSCTAGTYCTRTPYNFSATNKTKNNSWSVGTTAGASCVNAYGVYYTAMSSNGDGSVTLTSGNGRSVNINVFE